MKHKVTINGQTVIVDSDRLAQIANAPVYWTGSTYLINPGGNEESEYGWGQAGDEQMLAAATPESMTVSFRFPKELVNRLGKYAATKAWSRNQVAQMAIEQYLQDGPQ